MFEVAKEQLLKNLELERLLKGVFGMFALQNWVLDNLLEML